MENKPFIPPVYRSNVIAEQNLIDILKDAGYNNPLVDGYYCDNGLRIMRYKTEVWHLSISHPDRLPTLREIQWSRDEFTPHFKQMAFVIPANEPPIGEGGNYLVTLFELVYIDK